MVRQRIAAIPAENSSKLPSAHSINSKLTKLLLADAQNADGDSKFVNNLCMFFKFVALYRCRIGLDRHPRKEKDKACVVETLLDMIIPGRIDQKLVVEIPAQYYFLALSTLLSCDIDLQQDLGEVLHDKSSSILMLIINPVNTANKPISILESYSPFTVMAFSAILNHQSRVYTDDDFGFRTWLSRRDSNGRNIIHHLAAALNIKCLSELSCCIKARCTARLRSHVGIQSRETTLLAVQKLSNLIAELVNVSDNDGNTPLFSVIRDGSRIALNNINFIDELVNLGASLYHLNSAKQSLLMLALEKNKHFLIRPLIQRRVNVPAIPLEVRCRQVLDLVMARDNSGRTCLHYAAKANSMHCVLELGLCIIMYGVGEHNKEVGTSKLADCYDNKIRDWYITVRDEFLKPVLISPRTSQYRFSDKWSMQQFTQFYNILKGSLAAAVISHDITHGHSDKRSSGQPLSIRVINEVDDVLYPEQIKYEDRDLFPILAADAVRNIKRKTDSQLAANCCDCKGTCVFGYCPCMNAIDYDAYNENGRCRMLSKVQSAKYYFGGDFMCEKGGATPPPPNDPTKLGRSADAEISTHRTSSRRTMTSAGNSRRANAVDEDDSADKRNDKRRSIILPPLIVECGELCQCAKDQCRNRVTQNSSRMPRLEVFRSRKCGWGVKTLDPIKPGQYICTMSGLLTRSENVDDPMYCMSLIDVLRTGPHGERVDERDLPKDENERDRQFNLDSKDYGNIGRFLNHSCSPNCATTAVLHDEHDLRTPKIALFAMKSIPALTELTWYYSFNYWSGNGDYGHCRCGAMNCQWKHMNRENNGKGDGGGKNKSRKTLSGAAASRERMRGGSELPEGVTLLNGQRIVSIITPFIDTTKFWYNVEVSDGDGDGALSLSGAGSPTGKPDMSPTFLQLSGKFNKTDRDIRTLEISRSVEQYIKKKCEVRDPETSEYDDEPKNMEVFLPDGGRNMRSSPSEFKTPAEPAAPRRKTAAAKKRQGGSQRSYHHALQKPRWFYVPIDEEENEKSEDP